MHKPRKDKKRQKGAQHKRPGRQVRQERQHDALDRLLEKAEPRRDDQDREVAALRKTLGR